MIQFLCSQKRVRNAIPLFLLALLLGCGRMPPEEFWSPTAQDSSAIDSVVMANRHLLQINFSEPGFQFLKWVVPDSIMRKAIRDNPFKQRYQCDSMVHIFSGSRIFTYSFIATLDTLKEETTATVTVIETIPGILRLHAVKYTRCLRESIIITPVETLKLKYYDSLFTDTTMVVEKPIMSVAIGGCVLRKENGKWKLWKLSGGQRFYAPSPEDVPYLLAVDIKNGLTTTRYFLRPDTTQYGVQRFYGIDELLSYKVGDSLWVSPVNLFTTDPNHFYFFFFNRIRYPMEDTNKIRFSSSDTGIKRLFIEKIPFEVVYDSGGELTAIGWDIPIYVKGGGR